MPSYSRGDVVLVRYPFSDASTAKVRPAVVVSVPHVSRDVLVVPLTSRTASLLAGEFPLAEWAAAGLNVATAVKRGVYAVHETLVIKRVGSLQAADAGRVKQALRDWLGL